MRKSVSVMIIPDWLSLLLFLTILPPQFARASEKENYQQYEKLFKTLEMETLAHKKIKLSELTAPIVIVSFWASWCIPCLEEVPSLIKLGEKYHKNELAIVAINTDEENQFQNIAKIQKKLSIPNSFLIVPDKKFKIADSYKFSAIPVSIIFKKGKVIKFSNGPVDFLQWAPADLW